MKENKVEFQKEKFAAIEKMSKEMLTDIDVNFGTTNDDFLNETITDHFTGYIYSNLSEQRELVYYCEPPSFLDWLLRRRKKAFFTLKVKDLLLNPPKLNQSMRIYVVEDKQ